MLLDSVRYLPSAIFPENPLEGTTFQLSEKNGDFEAGLYTFREGKWVPFGTGMGGTGNGFNNVRVVAIQNIPLQGIFQIDGIEVAEGDIVLVTNQSDAKTNGPYIVAVGEWQRAPFANSSESVTPGSMVFVTDGENYANTIWYLVSDGEPVVLGTTELTYAVFAGSGSVQIGAGLQQIGDAIALEPTGISAGQYRVVQVDRFGRIVGGSNPTTLEGFGISDAQRIITGAASTITDQNLIANRVVISNATGKIVASDVTIAQLLSLAESATNTAKELAKKQNTIIGAASTVTDQNLAINRVVGSDGQGKIVALQATTQEVNHLSGVKSNVQEQLDSVVNKTGAEMTGPLLLSGAPEHSNQATTRQYVDQQVSSIAPMPRSIYASIPGAVTQFSTGVRWYPPFKCRINGARAFIDTAPNTTAVQIDIKKNGETVFPAVKLTVPTNANESAQAELNVVLETTDYITLAVLGGDGSDLSVRIDYIAFTE